jgi:hypothetical protein
MPVEVSERWNLKEVEQQEMSKAIYMDRKGRRTHTHKQDVCDARYVHIYLTDRPLH